MNKTKPRGGDAKALQKRKGRPRRALSTLLSAR
jgi:hypothetical protein